MSRKPQQERSQRRRDALLQAAVELLAEGGMLAVSHRAVAARAGLPPSTPGYFFSSIDELAAEALRVFTEREISDYRELARSAADDGGLDLDRLVRAAANRPVPVQAALAQVTIYLEAQRNPRLRVAVGEVLDAYRELTAELLRLVGAPDDKAVSSAFQALTDGIMLQHLAKPDDPPSPEVAAQALAALAAGFLLSDDERRAVLGRAKGPDAANPATIRG
jgi:DNA-binding transcriptional regulator YbjK